MIYCGYVINDVEILLYSWKKLIFVINFIEFLFGLLNYLMVVKVIVYFIVVIFIY